MSSVPPGSALSLAGFMFIEFARFIRWKRSNCLMFNYIVLVEDREVMKSKVLAGFIFHGTPVSHSTLWKLTAIHQSSLPTPSLHLGSPKVSLLMQSLPVFPIRWLLASQTSWQKRLLATNAIILLINNLFSKNGDPLCVLKLGFKCLCSCNSIKLSHTGKPENSDCWQEFLIEN